MGKISVYKDCKLEKPKIVKLLLDPTAEQRKAMEGTALNKTVSESAQTKIDGIMVPIIKFNKAVIESGMITFFELKSSGRLPECNFEIEDTKEIIKTIENPTSDNTFQVQILPPFDNVYKKINLTFYAYSIDTWGSRISVRGIYMVPDLHNFRLKAFGKLSTFDLFDKLTDELSLGMATNIRETDDERWIYCPSISYKELMENESARATYHGDAIDYWVDFWDNVNLIDIESQFNEVQQIDPIWITNAATDTGITDKPQEPIKTDATLTNSLSATGLQTFVRGYSTVTGGSSLSSGTDRVYQYYQDIYLDTTSLFLQDGDMKNDIFAKYEYAGECSGGYDYMKATQMNKMFIDKIKSNMIRVELSSPILAFMRGGKVNLKWYINNGHVGDIIKQADIKTNTDEEDINQPSGQVPDKQISGQYYIMESNFIYESGNFKQELLLSRPDSDKENYT